MKKRSHIAAASALIAAFAFSGLAHAQSGPVSWNGPYIGLHAGYAAASAGVTADAVNFSVKESGFVGGLYAGFNFNLGGAIAGLEADFGGAALRGDTTVVVGGSNTKTELKADWNGRIRARLGIPAERALIFIAGGWSTIGTKVNLTSISTPGQASSASATLGGWNIGGGIDYQLGSSFVVRGEYIYDSYSGHNYGTSSNPFFVDRTTGRLQSHTFRLGAALKF